MQASTAPPPRRAALQACRAGVRGVGSAAALRASCCCAPLFPLRLGPDVGPTRSLGRVLLPWLSVLVVLTGSSVMPDFQTVLASVRDQLAFVDRRLAELDAQRGDLQSERGRLATAVAVMEEHARSSGSGVPQGPEEPPLAARILDAVGGSSGRTRADLLRVFGPLGVNAEHPRFGHRALSQARCSPAPRKAPFPFGRILSGSIVCFFSPNRPWRCRWWPSVGACPLRD